MLNTITIKNTPPHTTTTTEGNSTKNAKADKKDSRDPDTESISTISTCSSTDEEGNWWEKQDNDKPPPPPPRTGLHSPFPSESTSVDDPVQISGVTGRSSPFDDFSSSIAQARFRPITRPRQSLTVSVVLIPFPLPVPACHLVQSPKR